MTPQKWQLLAKKDVSPHKWFPIEMRTYKLPNGKIIDDFSVTTIADVAMIVPITKDKKVILVNQFKPGMDEVVLEFPAGRKELHQTNLLEVAVIELEEEVGIRVLQNQLTQFAVLSGFPTKASEKVFFYLAQGCEFNSHQHLDDTEYIEVVPLSFTDMDAKVKNGDIWCAQTIAGWELAKKHFPNIFI